MACEGHERRYGILGMTLAQVRAEAERTQRPDAEYLTPDQAQEALCDGQWFQVCVAQGPHGVDYQIRILFRGQWLRLGRSDLDDQVRTRVGGSSERGFYENPLAYHRRAAIYGARVTPEAFYVLDALTDG